MKDFEKIYKLYFKDVFLYLKSLTRDESLAEELTAETFFKAMKALSTFRDEVDIRIWLCQIAKNTYFSYLKKQKQFIPIDEVTVASDINVEKTVSNKIVSEAIHHYLHQLEEPYKEVFYLRVFANLSFKQIATLFQRNENWACVTYYRARKKVKEKMEEYL